MSSYYERNKDKVSQKYQENSTELREKALDNYYRTSYLIECVYCNELIRFNTRCRHERSETHKMNKMNYKEIEPTETTPIDLNNFDTYKEGYITYFSNDSKKICCKCDCGGWITNSSFMNRHFNTKRHKEFLEKQKSIIIDLEELD